MGPDQAPFALDRASLERLLAHPAACELEHIHAAVERADHDDAAARALARGKLGLPLPAALVADVLVGVAQIHAFLALARLPGAEARDPMLALLQDARLADDPTGFDQATYLAFALWQLGPPDLVRPVIMPPLRRLVRHRWLPPRTVGLVGWIGATAGDPHLTQLYEEHPEERGDRRLAEDAGRLATDLWSTPLDGILDALPEQAPEPELPGVPIRAAPKVGRNDPCPCGSGLKFKRCCADKPAQHAAGLGRSRAERLVALEPRLEPDQVLLLTRADLARLDLGRLRDDTVIEVMQRQAQLHDWHRACLAVDELARRHGRTFADEHLEDVAHEAIAARRYDIARELVARLDDMAAPDLRLQLELAAGGADACVRLEEAARAAVASPRPSSAVGLAHAALRVMPGLGILLARGAVQASVLDAEVLLDVIEEARDELDLPPGDPAQELFSALGGVHEKTREATRTAAERAQLARTAAGLRADLDETTRRLAELQRQVADHQREVERAERASAEAAQRAARSAAEEQDRRALRSQIEELQALIREGNEERSKLRRELSAATKAGPEARDAREAPPQPHGRDPEDAEDVTEDLPEDGATRSIQIPRFAVAAAAALEAVPRNVAAAAMRTIGALAAGDPAAWRGVKQARDMPRQVLMARVGIHHRLLFRAEGDLDVIDLVTRESLLTTLKRLRSG